MELHLGGVTIHDADVSLTDYALAAETLFLRARLVRRARSAPGGLYARHARALFTLLSITSLLGGTFHGFLPGNVGTNLGWAMWIGTLLALGVTAVELWLLAACIAWAPGRVKSLGVVLGCAFVGYALVVMFVDHAFKIGILFYLPSTVVLLLVSVWKLVTTRRRPFALGALGLAVNLVAAGLQQRHVAIDAIRLSHNALFHVIEAVAFALLYGMCAGVERGDLRSEEFR